MKRLTDELPYRKWYWAIEPDDHKGAYVMIQDGVLIFPILELAEIWLMNEDALDKATCHKVPYHGIVEALESTKITVCNGKEYRTIEQGWYEGEYEGGDC